ncbi:hypothetical protein CIPAW_15G124700 [Carya illinoinensis]|uniref:Uncharacterized protein n=1 Tax=Carya illinoinensis TaxID=32201 RepID=A0A8T1NAP7_CARIL|nr:hypothetical protein CIPAW_15G124700 [Carya illinoinensis]
MCRSRTHSEDLPPKSPMPNTSAAEKHKAPDAASSQAAASPPHPHRSNNIGKLGDSPLTLAKNFYDP